MNRLDPGQCLRTLCNNYNWADMSESGICTNYTRAHVSGHSATIHTTNLRILKCLNHVFVPIGLGPMCPDTVQQFYSVKNVAIAYLNQMDPGPYVRTLYNNSNQAEISQSGTRDGVHMCHIWYLRQNKNAHMIFQWILITHK